jgi:hypothetical protein
MDEPELIRRILDHAPEYPRLTREELAILTAYLEQRLACSLSRLQRDPQYAAAWERARQQRSQLSAVLRYNRERAHETPDARASEPTRAVIAGGPQFNAALGDAKWSDVSIRFIDGHTVEVDVRGHSGTFDYRDFGMSDGGNRRHGNGKPTAQWKLLQTLATHDDQLHWGDRGAERVNQKRRERLAADLRRALGIPGDPIVCQDNGWKTRFKLRDS